MIDPAPLLAWYRAVARDLPWRQDPDPYAILLSELMCQQTRVDTAVPYFLRFRARWPTLQDLAAATEVQVVEAWAGLGYYRRARALHRCAVAAVAAGGLPGTVEGLRALPGIGPYTAGAIASIAFGQRAVAVDGNVQRVVSRLGTLDPDPGTAAGRRAVEAGAAALHAALPAGAHPGDLNQALMELGATVCTPRKPACGSCPLRTGCRAQATGTPTRWPRLAPRKAPVPIGGLAGLLVGPQGPLLVRAPQGGLPGSQPGGLPGGQPGGLLGGLWTPPVLLCAPGQPVPPPGPALEQVFADAGLQVQVGPPLGAVTHVFSHRRLQAQVHLVRAVGGQARVLAGWTGVRWGGTAGLSGLGRRVLALVPAAPPELGPALPLLAADGAHRGR